MMTIIKEYDVESLFLLHFNNNSECLWDYKNITKSGLIKGTLLLRLVVLDRVEDRVISCIG